MLLLPPIRYPLLGDTYIPNSQAAYNSRLTYFMIECDLRGWLTDQYLWEEFGRVYKGWQPHNFRRANKGALKNIRSYLVSHGVWVQDTTLCSYAQVLSDCLNSSGFQPSAYSGPPFLPYGIPLYEVVLIPVLKA